MTDKELEKIYNEAYRAVYWTAFSLLKNEDDAQDVVQDTFIALFNSYDSIKDKSKILPWLKKVAANKSLNRLTRTKTDNVEDEFFDDVEIVPEDFLPDSLVESAEMRKIIMDIINNSLSEDIRRTLILFYFDEMSTKEIAEALGIPEGTVSRRIHSAKKKIKKEVEKYEEENDTKLFMVVPFLTSLFTKEAEQVVLKPMPASLMNLSASTEAAEAAGSKLASQAIKKGTEITMKKIIIAAISVALAGAATTGIIYYVTHKDDNTSAKKKSKKKAENEIAEIDPDDESDVKALNDPDGKGDTSGFGGENDSASNMVDFGSADSDMEEAYAKTLAYNGTVTSKEYSMYIEQDQEWDHYNIAEVDLVNKTASLYGIVHTSRGDLTKTTDYVDYYDMKNDIRYYGYVALQIYKANDIEFAYNLLGDLDRIKDYSYVKQDGVLFGKERHRDQVIYLYLDEEGKIESYEIYKTDEDGNKESDIPLYKFDFSYSSDPVVIPQDIIDSAVDEE